jgi:hypothetical protein
VRKFQSVDVLSEIGLGVEYQRGRRLPQLSNGYLLFHVRSKV